MWFLFFFCVCVCVCECVCVCVCVLEGSDFSGTIGIADWPFVSCHRTQLSPAPRLSNRPLSFVRTAILLVRCTSACCDFVIMVVLLSFVRSASQDGLVQLWDPLENAAHISISSLTSAHAHSPTISVIRSRLDGEVFACGGHSGAVDLYDFRT